MRTRLSVNAVALLWAAGASVLCAFPGPSAMAGRHTVPAGHPRLLGSRERLEQEYRTRAAPALNLAGAGGGWAEGYYIHYWLYEWLFFCEAARWCEGIDYYEDARDFFAHRAVASMFEMYPGIGIYHSRRPVPMGDGGHYDAFGSRHDVNYHLRSIAHSTILVHDPDETWPQMRAGPVSGNDGGQWHPWPHHNGAVVDADAWEQGRELYDIADILAFEDRGTYLYVAGDCTRAYCPEKLSLFTRQIVFLRPDTFVVFDRVRSTDAGFPKTWVLQAMKVPEQTPEGLVVTNGPGRLFVQTLLPEEPDVRLVSGPQLYSYEGQTYPPARDTGPAPECRIEISPSVAAEEDCFLHVLTAADSDTGSVAIAAVEVQDAQIVVTVGPATIRFKTEAQGGDILLSRRRTEFTDAVQQTQ